MRQRRAVFVAVVSIHAPHAGSDGKLCRAIWVINIVSIHAPHTGSDCPIACMAGEKKRFNPRSPRGERRPDNAAKQILFKFQSTLPTRGATRSNRADLEPGIVSIHAPHAGSDAGRHATSQHLVFQSTLPTRGATDCPHWRISGRMVSIHAPHTGSD